ncbi:hypothetical protein Sru01_54640 [Sphaerisporangium rufum]|uniref:Lipoprotein n=1 Tax=Sphaerisporangium rufum TaxID=1381558 RepID=A0A919RAR1_9ACTN|nr:hypothetical protein [Sphaerisporangium rufum]GII80482.1 hypothetical protein Sru01_54640 [Sphaerisporangium rufum]
MRRLAIFTLLLAVTAGCGDRPTLSQVTGILREDGAALSRVALDGKSAALSDDRAGCEPGTRRSVYALTGALPATGDRAAATAAVASALAAELHRMGYQEGDNPEPRFGVNVSVVEKRSLGIVFTIAIRDRAPEVQVSGRTGCLPAG